MAITAFNISPATNGGAPIQFSNTVLVAANEKLRVRFTDFNGAAVAALEIVANGVTSYICITSREAWVTVGVAVGDVCRLRVRLNTDARSLVAGIIETIT